MTHTAGRIIPVILSGGAGTRLWPLSRRLKPKQLLNLIDPNASMMQQTLLRVGDGETYQRPIIVASNDHRFQIAEQLREIGCQSQIVLEPEGRNTAPAIALAACLVAEEDPEGLALVLPSDHVVTDDAAFQAAVAQAALGAAQDDAIVTFGLQPDRPETGFGYIKFANATSANHNVRAIDRFVEKPDQETAKGYLASGDYLWNAGMFMFKASAALKAFETYAPDVLSAVQASLAQAERDQDFIRPGTDAFGSAPSVSFDVAIMEKVEAAGVLPCDIGWSDVGSFEGLHEILEQDDAGNHLTGDVTQNNCNDTLLYSTGPAIAADGLKDIVLIATPDVVLALPKSQSQNVKALAEHFRKTGRSEADS